MIPEGYVKFSCAWDRRAVELPDSIYTSLERWRNKLYSIELIGAYPDGIGYGNISARIPGENRFFISGSATGGLRELGPEHYARVDNYDVDKNTLTCTGQTKASSESLSHAAVYMAFGGIGAVIHIHSKALWVENLDNLPTTDRHAEYGTPEMAREVSRLVGAVEDSKGGLIVMGGHEDGIIAFGSNLDIAGERILSLVKGA